MNPPNPLDNVKPKKNEAESPATDSFCFFYHSVQTCRPGDSTSGLWVCLALLWGVKSKNLWKVHSCTVDQTTCGKFLDLQSNTGLKVYVDGIDKTKKFLVEVNTRGEFPNCTANWECTKTLADGKHRFILPNSAESPGESESCETHIQRS